jgi:hypothetical protein
MLETHFALSICLLFIPIAAYADEPRTTSAPSAPAASPSSAAPSVEPLRVDTREHPNTPQTRPWHGWRLEGDVTTNVLAGPTPKTALGVGGGATISFPRVPISVRLSAEYFTPTTADSGGVHASIDMVQGSAGLCSTYRSGVTVLGCLGGTLGVLRPHGETPNAGIHEALLPIWNGVGELRLHVPIAWHVGFVIGGSAGLPLLRSELDYTRADGSTALLHKAAGYVLGADAGFAVFLP